MKTKRTFLVISILFCLFSATGQIPSTDWISASEGPGVAETKDLVTDSVGNTYAAGIYYGDRDFDNGPATVSLTSINYASGFAQYDVFVLKLDKDGNLLWGFSIGSELNDLVTGIALDKYGDLYIHGQYWGASMDLDPGPDSSFISGASQDVKPFLLKVNGEGDFIWGTSLFDGRSVGVFYQGIETDDSANVYLTGSFRGRVDFDPDTSEVILTAQGITDMYILKYNANGAFVWVKSMTGNQSCSGRKITVDPYGNILLVGQFQGSVDFDPGPDSLVLTTELVINPHADGFMLKMNPFGDLIWAHSLGWNNFPTSVSADTSGNIDIIQNGVLISYDSTGVFESSLNLGTGFFPQTFIKDKAGNIYIAGEYKGTLDFDPGPDQVLFQTAGVGDRDIFILKFNSAGEYIWAQTIGAHFNDYAPVLLLDYHGNVIIGGVFQGRNYFKPEGFFYEVNPLGGRTNYIIKIREAWATGIDDFEKMNLVKLYPNPARQQLHIQLDIPSVSAFSIEIHNLLGQTLMQHQGFFEKEVSLDIGHLPPGQYFVKYSDSQYVKTKAFVVK